MPRTDCSSHCEGLGLLGTARTTPSFFVGTDLANDEHVTAGILACSGNTVLRDSSQISSISLITTVGSFSKNTSYCQQKNSTPPSSLKHRMRMNIKHSFFIFASGETPFLSNTRKAAHRELSCTSNAARSGRTEFSEEVTKEGFDCMAGTRAKHSWH